MKKTLILLATLLWLGYWWRWYTCKICETCGCHKATVEVPTIQPESGYILFNKNDSNAMVQVGWAQYRDSLLSALAPNQNIIIEGHYLSAEPNTSQFRDMGLARANAIKLLFPDSLHSRINITSKQISARPTMNDYPWIGHSFSTNTETNKIEEIAENKTLVYFNYNSNQRIKDPEIETYLTGLATKHKDIRSSFKITGHTDDEGDEKSNMKLGLARASAIKNYLVQKGIEANRITIASLGESSPIATNDTKDGRQKNRRTEIEIIQKQ